MTDRTAAFLLTNLGFATLLVIGLLIGSPTMVHPLYLILLFALCSSPIIFLRYLNDRYALVALFSAVYFIFYGFLDLTNLFLNAEGPPAPTGVLSKTELVILVGGALAHAGYHITCRGAGASSFTLAKDWPQSVLILVGGAIWALCTWLSWQFNVYVLVDATNEATRHGLASLSNIQTDAFLIAGMLQPVGILMLAYAQCKYRRGYMIPLLIAVVLVQLVFGFVVDVKGEALIGATLVVLTKLLVDGKIPRLWLISIVTFVAVAFPVLQANRWVRDEYRLDHAQVAQNIEDTIKKAIAGSKRVTTESERAQTVFERMSMKGSVELIVSETGTSVPYQHGHTLSPLITALIPRLIWPTKPDVQAGQVMNQEFHVSESADTYISPSHLGELYWNFGWTGIALGMPIIGLLLGTVAARCDLSHSAGITRLLVIVVTIRLLILGFESSIAVQYSVWIRSLIAIGLLHILLSRRMPHNNRPDISRPDIEAPPASDLHRQPSFPNLMR
jgi:hypothetical protein